jgi:hypothetical protein
MHSGRGGAGNTFKAPKTTDATTAYGPASLFVSTLPQTSTKFAAGRGGAGNIRDASNRSAFSFDEELERQATRESKSSTSGAAYHVGRGGAGNWNSTRSPSSSGSRKDSSSSSGSTRSGFLSRLSHSFDRN